MFILKLAGKILLLPVWLILFVIGLAVKMTVQTYAVVRGILGFIFTLLIIATAYCYHDWVQVAFLFSLSVILYLILFAGVFVDTVLAMKLENGRFAPGIQLLQIAMAHSHEMARAQDRINEINQRVISGSRL